MTEKEEKEDAPELKEAEAAAEEAAEEPAEEPAEEAGSEAAEEARKEKKKKKVVRRRKTRKERENQLTVAVRLAVDSGKVEFGGKSAVAAGAGVKAKAFVLAGNAPQGIKDKVEGYAKSAHVPVIPFEGSTMELGSVCGKPFPVSVLSVFEEGTSNILEMAKKK